MWPENFVDATPLMNLVAKNAVAKVVSPADNSNSASAAGNSAHKKSCACLDCCS